MAETPLSKEESALSMLVHLPLEYLPQCLWEGDHAWHQKPRSLRKNHWMREIRRAACMAEKLPKLQRQNQALKKQIAWLRYERNLLRTYNRHFEQKLAVKSRVLHANLRDLGNWRTKAARIAAHLEIQPGETLVQAAARVAWKAYHPTGAEWKSAASDLSPSNNPQESTESAS